MRTATIIAKTHKGDWKLIASPEVPIVDQREQLRTWRGRSTHPDFATLRFQDSDGDIQTLRFQPEPKTKITR